MSNNDKGVFGPSGRQLAAALSLIGLIALFPLVAKHISYRDQPAPHDETISSGISPLAIARSSGEATKSSNRRPNSELAVGPGTWPDWAIVAFTLALTLLGGLQYRLARRTAEETKEALAIAKQSADAASALANAAANANKLTRDLFLEQHRPRITLSGSTVQSAEVLEDGSLSLGIGIRGKNGGSLPASDVSVHLKYAPVDGGVEAGVILEQMVLDAIAKAEAGWPLAINIPAHEECWPPVFVVIVPAQHVDEIVSEGGINIGGIFRYNHSLPKVWRTTTFWLVVTYSGRETDLKRPGPAADDQFNARRVPMMETHT